LLDPAYSQRLGIRAVIMADNVNVNRELIHRGLGTFREDMGGAEQQAMHGFFGRSSVSTPRRCSSKETKVP
jgi:hypothetical protein